jgi:hypothetical protein
MKNQNKYFKTLKFTYDEIDTIDKRLNAASRMSEITQSNGGWNNQNNAPQQNASQGGWNNSSGGQKGSFGHGSNANSGNSAPKRKWGAG